ncbi:MAG: pyridoxamine 5'-phosphate oxidase [Actinobacteria bacterium]|nr:MAG: pyridoxamine 5'-phosphate oxidase [Actinomycetota bacterium]
MSKNEDSSVSPEEILSDISKMRRSYGEAGLGELPAHPFAFFRSWLAQAHQNPIVVEANAMVLSTVDSSGQPWSRSVLLKGLSEGETPLFHFYTNYGSAKAQQLGHEPRASLLFPWYPLERQVIITGSVTKVSREESSAYFLSRPWASQIGAWASEQSTVLDSPTTLQEKWQELSDRYPKEVPVPDHWGGFALTAHTIEFWQGRHSRLHDRARYSRINNSSNEWEITRLYP